MTNIPLDETWLQPTTIYTNNNMIFHEGSSENKYNNQQVCRNTLEYKKWLHRNITIKGDILHIIESIKTGEIMAVSDGSFNHEIGTASWIIESKDRRASIAGDAISPGDNTIQSAYRSEILGLLAILDILRIITTENKVDKGSCIIACDGISALRKVFEKGNNIHPSHKHADLLSATKKILKLLPITILTQHIKGHQDEYTPYDILPRMAQLNVDADTRAKLQLQVCIQEKIDTLSFTPHHLSFPTIKQDNTIIRQQIKDTLYKCIADVKLLKAWKEKERITDTSENQIDWQAQEKAMNSSSLGHQRFICKWVSNTTATGKNMTRWKMRYEGQCPFCYAPQEDRDHILRCDNIDSKNIWNDSIKEFKKHLQQQDTKPILLNAIITELHHWRNKTTTNLTSYHNNIKPIIKQQREIGWGQFLEGLIGKK